MRCEFLAADVPDPCPRKVEGDCLDCQWSLGERSAIFQFDGKTTHAEADALARRQAVESMGRLRAQRELFDERKS
jgi:hypothetical protein